MLCLQTLIPAVMGSLSPRSWDFFVGVGIIRLPVRNARVGLAWIRLLRDCGDLPFLLPTRARVRVTQARPLRNKVGVGLTVRAVHLPYPSLSPAIISAA